MTDGRLSVIFMTAPDAETAETIARTVVDERLAACGNIVPRVTSIYRWQGAIQREAEVMVLFKTTPSREAALMQRLAALHPYEVPEAVAMRAASELPAYLQWVCESTEVDEG